MKKSKLELQKEYAVQEMDDLILKAKGIMGGNASARDIQLFAMNMLTEQSLQIFAKQTISKIDQIELRLATLEKIFEKWKVSV